MFKVAPTWLMLLCSENRFEYTGNDVMSIKVGTNNHLDLSNRK